MLDLQVEQLSGIYLNDFSFRLMEELENFWYIARVISRSAKKVLIVDDDLADVYLLQRTLRHCGVRDVQSVVTAEEASKYVIGLAPFEDRPLPDLIFADLKMGGIDGVHFISWLKRNPVFNRIPVIVFSGSVDPSDKEKAIESGANAFYQKTAQPDRLKTIVETALDLNGINS